MSTILELYGHTATVELETGPIMNRLLPASKICSISNFVFTPNDISFGPLTENVQRGKCLLILVVALNRSFSLTFSVRGVLGQMIEKCLGVNPALRFRSSFGFCSSRRLLLLGIREQKREKTSAPEETARLTCASAVCVRKRKASFFRGRE